MARKPRPKPIHPKPGPSTGSPKPGPKTKTLRAMGESFALGVAIARITGLLCIDAVRRHQTTAGAR